MFIIPLPNKTFIIYSHSEKLLSVVAFWNIIIDYRSYALLQHANSSTHKIRGRKNTELSLLKVISRSKAVLIVSVMRDMNTYKALAFSISIDPTICKSSLEFIT